MLVDTQDRPEQATYVAQENVRIIAASDASAPPIMHHDVRSLLKCFFFQIRNILRMLMTRMRPLA